MTDCIDMDGLSRHLQQMEGKLLEGEMFTPASLEISNEEWNQLVHADSQLASHIGSYLINHNKELEMLVTTTENCAEEQKLRADHFEKQLRILREQFDEQTKSYEIFEKQVEELTKSYRKIREECIQYKRKNKELWKSIESLEQNCDAYLRQINLLKMKQSFECPKCNYDLDTKVDLLEQTTNVENEVENEEIEKETETEDSRIICLRAYSEETSRKLELERSQRIIMENRLKKAIQENKDLQSNISWLEHRLTRIEDIEPTSKLEIKNNLLKCQSLYNLSSLDSADNIDIESSKHENLQRTDQLHVPLHISIDEYEDKDADRTASPRSQLLCQRCGQLKHFSHKDNTQLKGNKFIQKNGEQSTLLNYRDIFAEIFEKLRTSKEFVK